MCMASGFWFAWFSIILGVRSKYLMAHFPFFPFSFLGIGRISLPRIFWLGDSECLRGRNMDG